MLLIIICNAIFPEAMQIINVFNIFITSLCFFKLPLYLIPKKLLKKTIIFLYQAAWVNVELLSNNNCFQVLKHTYMFKIN